MTQNNDTEMELQTENSDKIEIKKPKRILYFSDGTMEEYSDSEDEQPAKQSTDVVDASKLGWGPWMLYKLGRTGSAALGVCDYVGESLASFLGITTPKYQYELEEYMRIEKERKTEEENSKGWLNPDGGETSKDREQSTATTRPPSKDGKDAAAVPLNMDDEKVDDCVQICKCFNCIY